MLPYSIAMAGESEIARAKQLAACTLGENLAKFPLLFCKAAFFGRRPSKERPGQIRNGSVALVDLGTGPLAITCWHVIACYRRIRKCSNKVIFQIGNVELDPLAQLIDEDRHLDLASIRLTHDQAKQLTSEGEIGSCIFKPKAWPSPVPIKGDFVAFSGFPGAMRRLANFDDVVFRSWSSGASEISSVSEYRFVSAFEREYWVKSFGAENYMTFNALGGMSGGPAFVARNMYWEFIGVVIEYSANFDTIFFASARALRADGTIEHPSV